MQRLCIWLAIILVLACSTAIYAAQSDIIRDNWMGIFLGQNKIGYIHSIVSKDKLQNKEVYRLQDVIITSLQMEDKKTSREYTITRYVDLNANPILSNYENNDNGSITRMEARFTPSTIQCKTTTRWNISNKAIPIEPGMNFTTRLEYEIGLKTPAVGEEIKGASFDAERFVIARDDLHALRREQVTFNGKSLNALVMKHENSGVIDWRLDSGELVRSEIPSIGAVMIAQDKKSAIEGLDNVGVDLDTVKVDKPITDPRHAVNLTIRLIGMPDESLVVSDSRQKTQFSSERHEATYSIHTTSFKSPKAAKLPIRNRELAAYTKPTPGIESSNKRIINHAKEIVAGETSAYKAACKLRKWVYSNIEPSDDGDAQLSAVNILIKRRGCCRHNAVLFAALARSISIPTRLAAGLIYDGGEFHFHVWNEIWVGSWVPLDPTYPGDFVDATHIKFVAGDIAALPALGRAAGRLRAEIVNIK